MGTAHRRGRPQALSSCRNKVILRALSGSDLYLQQQEAKEKDEQQPSGGGEVWQQIHGVPGAAVRRSAPPSLPEFLSPLTFMSSRAHMTRKRRSWLLGWVAQTLTLGHLPACFSVAINCPAPQSSDEKLLKGHFLGEETIAKGIHSFHPIRLPLQSPKSPLPSAWS